MKNKTIVKEKPKSNSIRAPETTIENLEEKMIALAMKEAERQLEEGTASSQIITHFLKLGSTETRQKKEHERKEMELIDAKIENYKSAQHVEELYAEAMEAMQSYKSSN